MKLELGLYGTDSITSEPIVPNAPVTLTQTDDDEIVLSLGNLKSDLLMGSEITVSRDQRGWLLDITHEGDPVVRLVLSPNAELIWENTK